MTRYAIRFPPVSDVEGVPKPRPLVPVTMAPMIRNGTWSTRPATPTTRYATIQTPNTPQKLFLVSRQDRPIAPGPPPPSTTPAPPPPLTFIQRKTATATTPLHALT